MYDRRTGNPDGALGPLVCPFVALADNRDARSEVPDRNHRCYAEAQPAPRAIAHQQQYCLTAAFPACPTFQDWARRESARAVVPAAEAAPEAPVWEPPAMATEPEADGPRPELRATDEERDPGLWGDDRAWAAPPAWESRGEPGRTAELARGRPATAESAAGTAADSARPTQTPEADRLGGEVEPPAFLLGRQTARAPEGRREAPDRDRFGVPEVSPLPRPPSAPGLSRRPNPDVRPDGSPRPGRAGRVDGPGRSSAAGAPIARPAQSRVTPALAEEPTRPPRPRSLDRAGLAGLPTLRELLGRGRDEEVAGQREPDAPPWERPVRPERFPELHTRMSLPQIPRLWLGAVALVVAALVLFFLPTVAPRFFGAAPVATPLVTPSAAPSASVAPTPPPLPTPTVYTVAQGDTLSGIATRYGLTVNELLKANPQIKNPNVLAVGDQLTIPVKGALVSGGAGAGTGGVPAAGSPAP